VADLVNMGYGREKAQHIVQLLEEEDLLDYYLARGKQQGCVPVTRVTQGYPNLLNHRLGGDAPGCLWAKGELSLLNTPAISLVGSRELRSENREFAEAVGIFAARRGLTLISGNARGADQAAQNACLQAGGSVISIVADELEKHREKDRILYLSEDGFAEPFSAQRALSRNRCIHAMGRMVFVAQSDFKKGGTWQGSTANLRHNWSPVLCFRDGSEASLALEQAGAYLIGKDELSDFDMPEQMTIF
jgi:predicted Rossmann fold nucleotide-binding protein DprA/Smf involved in DNA uptake